MENEILVALGFAVPGAAQNMGMFKTRRLGQLKGDRRSEEVPITRLDRTERKTRYF